MDINSTTILNPWWENPEAINSDPYIRAISGKPWYFDNPIKKKLSFEKGQIYILRGPRQVGKTTLMKEMIASAIKTKVIDAKSCLFITCEALEDYKELQKILLPWLGERKNKRAFICLDEITFVEQWQRALLWIINAGLLENSTVLISGSNTRDLKKSAERFPGRKVKEISLYPLSPGEYRIVPFFQSYDREKIINTYLEIGGFPHAIRDYCESGKVSDDTYETYANWIFGDAHRFNLTREILLHILYRIYDTVTSQMTYQRLVEKSPVKSHETAQAYIEHLEMAFLCKVLSCYDPNKDMGAPRKAKKIYFIDPLLYAVTGGLLRGLRNTFVWWKQILQDLQQRGNIFESIVVNEFIKKNDRVYYWYSANTRREVDVVIPKDNTLQVYEIKSQEDKVKPVLGMDVQVITPSSFPF